MAKCGCLCISAFLVALLAVFVGLMHAGRLRFMAPFLAVLKRENIGLTPAVWGDKPWYYEYTSLPRLEGKVAIVTGANSGVGFWTAMHLARQGAHVYVGCRSTSKCDKAVELIKGNSSAANVEPAIVDVSSMASVRKFAAAFREKHDILDIYVANAGIAMAEPQGRTDEGIEPIFATNHVGHQLLYTLLEDLIQSAADKNGDARVVAVSSAAHFNAEQGCALTEKDLHERYDEEFPFKMFAYGRSKLANVLFAKEVAARNVERKVFANSVHPGAVQTEIWGKFRGDDKPKGFIVERLNELIGYFKESMWTSEEGALTQVYLAAADEVRVQEVRGRYFHPQAEEVLPNRQWAVNWTHQKALWTFTEELIAKAAERR
eukprot:TRINITY_DN12418_c0_g3_i1.p1 TRINITY_DN12418_c0_g3~~TRINITY_DN12418_c0_g3_i1.p1  ORF type:complete len:375 (+),score=91.50 TRINITY_DN12418_c0_g3_i1:100-1224(+)